MEKKDLTIILVHGAWGDGSHWRHVIPRLVKAGYQVRSAQNPLTSLTHDIERTTDLINAQEGKVLLVGHSYGGSVISGAGNNQKVIGLVYIAAFAPDAGESLSRIFSRHEAPAGAASIYPDSKGFLWIKYDEYRAHFCADLDEDQALVLSLAQRPIHATCFEEPAAEPAWRTKPSWYQVSDADHMIPPRTQQEMADRIRPRETIHLDASHASLASKAEEVSNLIIKAASSF
ncbi:alpha/beta hydrolase [Sphingobacterium spiritivorum]|uniref:alpha/beta hydrolase n=1 Tax=Sphingobacterium spiritivorum TaxID=258 RepID=UPI003DA21BAF